MNIATGLRKMRRFVAGISIATLVFSMFVANTASAATFSDVPADAWFYTYVEQLASAGIIDTTKTNYRPADLANRAEAAKLLVEAAGLPMSTDPIDAKDVVAGSWYEPYIKTAVANGIMSGYEDTMGNKTGYFGPQNPVTREQFAKMAANAMSLAEKMVAGHSFPDVPTSSWSHNFIETLYYWSVVDGYPDGTFRPGANINRAEIAKMVVGAMNPVKRDTSFMVQSASATSPTMVTVTFSADVDDVSAAIDANYVIKDSSDNELTATVSTVTGNVVTLTTADQTANKPYTLTVSNVTSVDSEALTGGTATFNGWADVVGGQLNVAVASETPAASTIPTKTANNTVLVLNFTAPGQAAQVSGITVTKSGFYNDSSVKVVAYDSNEVRISNGVTFSDGKADLSFYSPVSIAAGSSAKVYLKVSISGAASGTLGLSVVDAQSITNNSSSLSGSFPLQSATHNIVDGTATVAAGTVDSVTISATTRTVDIGDNIELSKFKITETSSKEDLKLMSLTLFNNGSAADGDLKNFTLFDSNNVELAKVTDQSNKLVRFDLSASPYLIQKGTSRNLSVKVDVANGATRTAQLIVQNDFDSELVGSSTQASILATADAAGTDTSFPIGDNSTTYNTISINEGTLTVSKANTSPSGDITIGATDAVLGSFELKAAGEDMELQRIKVDLSSNGDGTANQGTATTGAMECISTAACDLVGTIKVAVDENLDGKPDKTLLSTTTSPTTLADLWKAASLANYDLSAFYTVKAGKTVNLLIIGSVTSDTADTATGETLKVGIKDVYHYKKASLKYGTSASTLVQANQLAVTTSNMTVSKNTGYGDQTMVSQSGAKIGSFVVKAGAAEGINITSITLTGSNCAAGTATGYTNVLLKQNNSAVVPATADVQLGSTKATVTLDNNVTSNTYSISNLSLNAGAEKTIDVYADMASGATNVCLKVGASGVSGTGINSQTAVTGPSTALALQTITAATSGKLTISLANDTPVSKQYVAGTTDNQVLMVKLAANNAEDIYIKKMNFRVDASADDVAIKQAVLKVGTVVGTLTQVGSTLSWQEDSTNPGFIEWTFSGSERPKVVKNGTLYVGLYLNFTSSSEQTVTGKTPTLNLANVEAEGLSTLSASDDTTGLTLLNSSGIVVLGSGQTTNGTYVTSGQTTLTTALSGIATTTLVTNGGNFTPGDVIFIDETNDGFWDPASEELMIVIVDGGTDLVVQRGAFGTTAQAAYTVGKTIFVLNGGLGNVNGIVANAAVTLNTKPVFSVNPASPTGAATGGLDRQVFIFDVKAETNTADPAENKVVLTSVDITTAKSGVSVANLKLYPSTHDQDSTYVTTCVALSQTKWRCTLSTTGGTNEIIEGQTNSYIVRADVNSGTNTSNSLEVYIANLGSATSSGDVVWTDGTTSSTWVYQTTTQVKAANALTYGASSGGSFDATAPTISTTAGSFAFGEGATTTGDTLDLNDTITITFTEAIDPTTVKSTLVPGGSAVAVAAGETGDISMAATGVVTVANIATTDVDGGAANASTYTNTATLNSAGTVLTLTITSLDTGTGALSAGEVFGDVTGLTTTIKDLSGNLLADSAITASGAI
jgi:hypothetical protein